MFIPCAFVYFMPCAVIYLGRGPDFAPLLTLVDYPKVFTCPVSFLDKFDNSCPTDSVLPCKDIFVHICIFFLVF